MFRPFQNKWHNYLDLFLLTNLLLVNTLTISNYYFTVWDSDKSSDSIAASQATLIAMPLVLCIIVLLGRCFYERLLPYLGKNERLQTFFIRVTSHRGTIEEESLPERLLDVEFNGSRYSYNTFSDSSFN